jgi:serine phosphatase RsbU (regulator of sigma subunit)
VGCLVGYIAEAQERDRERRLEDQLLIANYQREIDLSSQLQPSLMPSLWLNNETGTAPAQPESSLEVGAAMKTARTLGGGDYFDLIPLSEGRIGLCIADVSGKSVRAQARLPLLKYSLRALAPLYLQPDKLVERLNETLAPDLQPELYIALCYIVLDPRKETLSWCNAGHIAPLLLNPQSTKTKTGDRSTLLMMKPVDKAVETAAASGDNEPDANAMVPEPLETDGPAIGMFPDMVYEAHSRPWQPGSQLLLYTDGLTDAFSFRGSEDGESQVSKLAARLQRETHREPRELAQELVDLADAVLDDATPLERAHTVLSQSAFKYDHELAGDPDTKHRDDITVVIVRYKTTVDSETT